MLSVSCYTTSILCTFTNCSKNSWKCWRWFLFQILLVCFWFLSHTLLLSVSVTPYHSLYVHQLLKKIRENVGVDFFSNPWLFIKFVFDLCHTLCCFLFLLHQKHSYSLFINCSKKSWNCWGWFFFNFLFVYKVLLVTHFAGIRYTNNILCMFTNFLSNNNTIITFRIGRQAYNIQCNLLFYR